MTLRVLHVTQTTDWGGVPWFAMTCARAQLDRSFEVAVACPSITDLPPRLDRAGIPRLVWEAGRDPGPRSIVEAIALKRLITRWDPDIVHLHSSKAGLAGRLFRYPGKVVIFQPHAWSFEHVGGPVSHGALAWERRAAKRCDAIICVSEGEKQRGIDMGIDAAYRVITNGLVLDEWTVADDADRVSARSHLGLSRDPLVVCVGRLIKQKGQEVLLTAWTDVLERVPNARLVLVGDGPMRDELASRSVPRATLAGGSEEVGTWMAAADVMVLPSRWEGMSVTMLEAMSRGRSLVATEVAGVREAMGDEGAIVPPEDPGRLSAALVERLLDPDLARREGSGLRARIEERFSFERTEQELESLYRELLERHPKS